MAPFNIWSDWLNWVSSLERIHNGRAVLLALSMSLARCRYKTGNWTRCPFQWSSPRCVAIHRTEHELRTLQESKPNCLSRVLSKRLNEWSWSLAWGLHSIFKHLQGNECLRNKGTFLRNFAPNSGLKKFRHGKSIAMSSKLDGLTRPRYWMHVTRQSTVTLTPPLRFVVDFLYNCSYSSAIVDKIFADTARRSVRLR